MAYGHDLSLGTFTPEISDFPFLHRNRKPKIIAVPDSLHGACWTALAIIGFCQASLISLDKIHLFFVTKPAMEAPNRTRVPDVDVASALCSLIVCSEEGNCRHGWRRY